VPDDWGGDTIFVDVSALTKQGVDKLLEMILLQAELLLELKANPDRRAKGNVMNPALSGCRRHGARAQKAHCACSDIMPVRVNFTDASAR